MDYSFLKLYDSINESINDNEFKTTQLSYYIPIQLSPTESYCQMTNYEGGLSILSDFTCEIIDNCGNVLADVTSNVFTDEFTDAEGVTQTKIEFVNLTHDFYGRAVFIKFSLNSSDVNYYTRPIKITNKDIEKTCRFDYTNNDNLLGLSYIDAGIYQSIRLALKFTSLQNNTEIGSYYQISTKNTISTRPLKSIAKSYLIENIDTFAFERLQELFFHDIIYKDGIRITDNPLLEVGDRIGESNIFKCSFNANFDKTDKYIYDYQVFDGMVFSNFIPTGNHVTGTVFNTFSFDCNLPITLNSGILNVYDMSDASLVGSFNEVLMVVSGQTLNITTNLTLPNGEYYVNITGGLISGLGIDNEEISDNSTWTFKLGNADYSSSDYSEDYFIN